MMRGVDGGAFAPITAPRAFVGRRAPAQYTLTLDPAALARTTLLAIALDLRRRARATGDGRLAAAADEVDHYVAHGGRQ